MFKSSPLQQVEFFHLTFLRLLEEKVDKSCYVLKGGCNLRFFFGSCRYSEDMDLDLETVAIPTLHKNVEQILTGKALRHQLRTRDLEIERHSAPKQTATTQRWKVSLQPSASDLSVHTKIEFSRRGIQSGAELAGIDPAISQTYQIPLLSLKHYNVATAIRQKIQALLHRKETQARDVFDLNILLSRAKEKSLLPGEATLRSQVEEKVLSISYEEFRAQVVSYLAAREQAHYADQDSWEQIQLNVTRLL